MDGRATDSDSEFNIMDGPVEILLLPFITSVLG